LRLKKENYRTFAILIKVWFVKHGDLGVIIFRIQGANFKNIKTLKLALDHKSPKWASKNFKGL